MREEEDPAAAEHSEGRGSVWPLLALVALLVLAAVSCGNVAEKQQGPAAEDEPQATADAVAELERPSLGDEDAPVVMVEFADYQ